MEKTIEIDEEELKEAITTVDQNRYGNIKIETFEKLMGRYYEKSNELLRGYEVIGLIMLCSKSFDFDLHYGYCLAAFSFVGKHGGRPRTPEAKEVSKMLKEDKEKKNKNTECLQTTFF